MICINFNVNEFEQIELLVNIFNSAIIEFIYFL
jgi:hypothetical protein